jgi:adenylate cyclase
MQEAVNLFRAGLKRYRASEFDRASAQFREVLALHPGDTLSQTYVQRCEYLKAHPVNGEWDGVWRMVSK